MQVTLNALPASLAEFRNLSLNTPDEVVAGFLCALNLYCLLYTSDAADE